MHPVVRTSIAWFSDEGYALRGIVHVGAHDGEEIPWYLHRGHRPILAFEPHPDAYAQLLDRYGQHALCFQLALGDQDGQLTLHVPVDGFLKGASKYQPIPTEGEAHAWTKVPHGERLSVPLRRFDSWVAETCIDLSPFDVLVVDVQGMELEVLRGMGRRLDGFRFLAVECSERPMYDGEPPAREVIDWLRAQGFEARTAVETADGTVFHNDILFLRTGAPQPSAEASNGSHPPLREWARKNGWPDLKDHGPVPKAIKSAYAESFPE